MYEKKMAQVPLGPLFGKQNIQAKEVFFFSKFENLFWLCGYRHVSAFLFFFSFIDRGLYLCWSRK